MKTRTIDALLDIMNDTEVVTRRRIESAEYLLGYEASVDAVNRAREYLASVFDNKDEAIADRMDALQISRKYEAKKIMPQTVHLSRLDERDRREAWREYEIRKRRDRVIMATKQIPPHGYADDLRSPDYVPPPGDHWPPGTYGGLKVIRGDRER